MKRRVLAVAVASALAASPAFAAQDTSGMRYTSAAEGFYASIRARFNSGGTKDAGVSIENSGSRIGVRGTNDLGGGLEGFYLYEMGVEIDDGGGVSTRLGHVGLRGGFGEIVAGSFWGNDYNWTHGSTDIANVASGNLIDGYGDRPGRVSRSLQYTTPELNGFRAAARATFDSGRDNSDGSVLTAAQRDEMLAALGDGADDTPAELARRKMLAVDNGDGDNTNVDAWNLSAIYNRRGFTIAGSYNMQPKAYGGALEEFTGYLRSVVKDEAVRRNTTIAVEQDDRTAWTARLGYASDNWYVTGWYSKVNSGDVNGAGNLRLIDGSPLLRSQCQMPISPTSPCFTLEIPFTGKDTAHYSVAAGITLGKVNLYALYEKRDATLRLHEVRSGDVVFFPYRSLDYDDVYTTIGVQYNLGANSRVWIEYAGRDLDTDESADDSINIGLRHDF